MAKPSALPEHKQADREEGGDSLGLERLVFFSDAVYAIAITLLALEIRLPAISGEPTNAQLVALLASIWPKYLSYGLSFVVIGQFWMAHHRKFRLIAGYDRRLIQINLLQLMVVAFIPFPTSVIGEYGDLAAATIFYAAVIIAYGLFSLLLWWYARRAGLVRADAGPAELRAGWVQTTIIITIFAISIPVALVDADAAKYMWLLVIPAGLLVH